MNGYLLKQNSAAFPLMFFMADETDHFSGKTGLAPTVLISKNGAAFAAPAGAVTELSDGWYKVAGNAIDTDTLGPLLLSALAPGADPIYVVHTVLDTAADVWAYANKALTPVPPPPVYEPSLCQVTATVVDGEANPVANSVFTFDLVLNTTSKAIHLLYGRTITAHTNSSGVLVDADGHPYQQLQRPDHIVPAGSYWMVTNTDLLLNVEPFEPNGNTFDLLDLVAP